MTDLHKTTEPVEPVAYLIYKHGELYTTKSVYDYRPKGGAYTEIPLYTTPPSVDALIAEAVAKEREACAKIGEDFDKERPQSNYGRCIAVAIRARGQK